MRGDDFAKQAAATNIKGVVGNKGNTAPSIPNATKKRPVIFNSKLNIQ